MTHYTDAELALFYAGEDPADTVKSLEEAIASKDSANLTPDELKQAKAVIRDYAENPENVAIRLIQRTHAQVYGEIMGL